VKTTKGHMKDIIEKIDQAAPKIHEVDYAIMDRVLNDTDFTKCQNSLEALKLFYEQMWVHVIFRLEDDLNLYQRENGRLIVEADANRRKAERLQEENETLRERLQEKSDQEA